MRAIIRFDKLAFLSHIYTTKSTLMDIFFLTAVLPILYLILVIAFCYAIFNISTNSNRQTKLLKEILEEIKEHRKNS